MALQILLRSFVFLFLVIVIYNPLYAAHFSLEPQEFKQLKKLQEQVANKNWHKLTIGQIKQLKDPTARDLMLWLKYSNDHSDSFANIKNFILHHQSWPNLDRIKISAEKALEREGNIKNTLEWFSKFPPVSNQGRNLYHFAQLEMCLSRSGKNLAKCQHLIKEIWHKNELSEKQEKKFLAKYGSLLDSSDYNRRVNNFIWEEKWDIAKRYLAKTTPNLQQVYKLRIGLGISKNLNDKFLRNIPKQYREHPGLRYQLIQLYSKKKQLMARKSEVIEILGRPYNYADKWWKYRNIVIRDLLQEYDFNNAYRVAKNHGLRSGGKFAEAEWMAGWIALRFLHKPEIARTHLNNFAKNVSLDMSKSRAYYWLAQCEEALGNRNQKEVFLKKAAEYSGLFYGQIANLKLQRIPHFRAAEETGYSAQDLAQFKARSIHKAAFLLLKLNANDLATKFVNHSVDMSTTKGEKLLAIMQAKEFGQLHLAVTAAKKAANQGYIFAKYSHPIINYRSNPAIHPAFVHAIIKQESVFNKAAISSAGARGMMQLMPATAELVAKSRKIPFKLSALTKDPFYNIRLGQEHLIDLVDYYDGCKFLAILAYNAGAGNVDRWVRTFGDPRKLKTIDEVLDWLELVPYGETRNYVQRVMENMQVYYWRYDKANFQQRSYLLADLGLKPTTKAFNGAYLALQKHARTR